MIIKKTCFYLLIILGNFTLLVGEEGEKVTSEKNSQAFHYQVSKEDKERIYELIHTMAHTNLLGLGLRRDHLVELGDQIDRTTPPLQFLATIFANPTLAEDMAKIRTSRFKYNSFINGLEANMIKEYQAGRLCSEIEGFANYLGVSAESVKCYIDKGINMALSNPQTLAFKPLVDYLISEKNPR